MTRLIDPGVTLVRGPVPVTIGRGGLAPIAMLSFLFGLIATEGGLPVLPAVLVGAVGGTVSLVLHELGHVRAAGKLGSVRPLGVTLVWLGAATRLEGAYGSGREQARVALAGPRVSFTLAAGLVPVLFLPAPVVVKDLVITLAALNVGIGALSLVPVSPLDGYKLVLGLVWSTVGSEAAARRLIRRAALVWTTIELGGLAVLLVERPEIGALAATMAAALAGQKLYAQRSERARA